MIMINNDFNPLTQLSIMVQELFWDHQVASLGKQIHTFQASPCTLMMLILGLNHLSHKPNSYFVKYLDRVLQLSLQLFFTGFVLYFLQPFRMLTARITFQIVWLLLPLSAGIKVTVDSYEVQFIQGTTLSVNGATNDSCGMMVLSDRFFYHAQMTNVSTTIEQWDYPFVQSSAKYSRGLSAIKDYSAVGNGTQILLATETGVWVLDALSGSATGLPSPSSFKWQTFIISGDAWVYQFASSMDILSHYPSMTGTGNHYALPPIRGIMRFTPDKSKFIIASFNSELYFYSTANVTQLALYNDSFNAYFGVTQDLHFSSDSETLILETGPHHPVRVISMSNFTVLKEFYYTKTILLAAFINSSPLMFIRIPGDGIYIRNTETGNQVPVTDLNVSVTRDLFTNFQTYFMCSQNSIRTFNIQANEIIASNLANSNNTTASNTTLTTTHLAYLTLEMTGAQQAIMNSLTMGHDNSMPVLGMLMTVAHSNPFTFYLLSFINFFTISSHYILLNMTLPQPLYEYLSSFYNQVNLNIISKIFRVPAFYSIVERVDRQRLLDLQLTTDLIKGQLLNFIMMMISVALFPLLIWLVRKLRRGNLIRQWVDQPYREVVIGQYAALMLPLTSPWVFFIKGAYLTMAAQINLIFQYCLLGVSGYSSAFYLYLPFKTLNAAVLETWYNLFSNLLFPLLLVLSNPNWALSILALYCLLGVIIGGKQRDFPVNKAILALYQFLFHCCFIVIRVTSNNSILVYTTITCLALMLVGSLHHVLFIVFIFCQKGMRHCQKSKKVIIHSEHNQKPELQSRTVKLEVKPNIETGMRSILKNPRKKNVKNELVKLPENSPKVKTVLFERSSSLETPRLMFEKGRKKIKYDKEGKSATRDNQLNIRRKDHT